MRPRNRNQRIRSHHYGRGVELTDSQVRAWLTNLYQPGALADPVMRDLLQAHGRAYRGSDLAVTKDARQLLRDKLERLLPRPEAPEYIWRPYRVLTLCYFDPHSHHTAARLLGLSSRQLSREKLKAIRLLRAELEATGSNR